MAYPFAQHNLRWPCTFESTLLANFKSWAGNVPTGNATFFTAGITQVKQAFTGITTVAQISGSTSSWLFTGPAATFPGGDSNGFVGLTFTTTLGSGAGLADNQTNVICIGSSTTTITLRFTGGAAATTQNITATLQNNAWVYVSNWSFQNLGYIGTNTSISTASHTITSVSSSGSNMTVLGAWTDGGSNAYVGAYFTVAGFTAGNAVNNGGFICTASSAGSITLTNPFTPTSVTAAGTAVGINVGTIGSLATGNSMTVENGTVGTLSAGNLGTYVVAASGTTSVVLTNASPGVDETKVGYIRMDQFKITSVANTNGTTTVYTGIFPLGAPGNTGSNGAGYKDYVFVVSGFTTHAAQNNGTFVCTASTATTLTLANTAGISESGGTYAARGMSGVAWCMQTAGYTQTNDPAQAVWSLIDHTNQITTANGNGGAGTVTYTLSVTPDSRLRVNQYFTVTGTTNFNGSFLIQSINSGAKTVTVTATNANVTESGLTATGQVLPFTIVPPWHCGASYQYLDILGGDLQSYFRGTFDATQQYTNGNIIWGGSADPNYYITYQTPTMLILSAAISAGNTVYTFAGASNTNIVANQHVTVTGMYNTTYNITNVVITVATGNTFTVVTTTQTGTAPTNQGGVANIVPTNDTATQGTQSSPKFWIPYVAEFWQSNDSASLAVPTTLYLKLEYAQGVVAQTPAIAFQIGAATTGHGAITGLRSFRDYLGHGAFAPSGANMGSYESMFWSNGNGGEFSFFFWVNGNAQTPNWYLNFEWGKTNSGQGNGLWVVYWGAGGTQSTTSGNGGNCIWVTTPPIGQSNIVCQANLGGYPLAVPINSGSLGGQVGDALYSQVLAGSWALNTFNGATNPVCPVFAHFGSSYSNPLTGLVTLNAADRVSFGLLTNVDAYGNRHTYTTFQVATSTQFVNFGSQDMQVAMRWDT